MDASILHAATEELAGYWSEVTSGDLTLPTGRGGDVGDLFIRCLANHLQIAAVLSGEPPIVEPTSERVDLADRANLDGAGYEEPYRRVASAMVSSFGRARGPDPIRSPAFTVQSVASLCAATVTAVRADTQVLATALGLDAEWVHAVAAQQ